MRCNLLRSSEFMARRFPSHGGSARAGTRRARPREISHVLIILFLPGPVYDPGTGPNGSVLVAFHQGDAGRCITV